jgi:hypothetical protein
MKTKKISLTEFKKLVKNIIKEESSKKKMIRESWEGVDADNETSLFEYGFVAKQRPDKDYSDEWFVLYDAGNNKFDTGHIRETELDNIVLGKEWANEKDIQSLLKFVDSDRESWLQSGFVNKLSDLISYFGVENIMGSSYGGFSQEEAEQMLMQESVKPKTQKIKLSEVKELVRKSLKEGDEKKFVLAIDKQSNRYFVTKKDDNYYIVVNEKTKEVSNIEVGLAKQIFRAVGDANDYENKEFNQLIK